MSETLNMLRFPREEYAIQKANELTKIYTTPLIPVQEIAEGHGVSVVFATMGRFNEEVAGFCDFEERKLVVNADDVFVRRQFTMAHELGHWVLHRDLFEKDPKKYRVLRRFQNSVSDPIEREANTFAANLLVPKHLLQPVKHVSSSTLASIFGVSKTMMEIRLQEVDRWPYNAR